MLLGVGDAVWIAAIGAIAASVGAVAGIIGPIIMLRMTNKAASDARDAADKAEKVRLALIASDRASAERDKFAQTKLAAIEKTSSKGHQLANSFLLEQKRKLVESTRDNVELTKDPAKKQVAIAKYEEALAAYDAHKKTDKEMTATETAVNQAAEDSGKAIISKIDTVEGKVDQVASDVQTIHKTVVPEN